MILNRIFATFALLSLGLTVWQWLAARRFPLHRRARSAELRFGAEVEQTAGNPPSRSSALQPGVTLLKPLNGADEHTESCLRSWFTQDYAGAIQILFGIASADDPACSVVKKLLAEFPQRDAQLVVCSEQLGPNAKVSKLAQIEPLAKHEILVISDADVRVPPDLLVNLVAPLVGKRSAAVPAAADLQNHAEIASRTTVESTTAATATLQISIANCFYRLANATTLAMQWEAIAINADFWSQVLQNASFRKLDFALGAVMAVRRQHLSEIGGFKALVNHLADDYQLGRRITQRGHRIELCPVVVECWSAPMGWREVWKHQLRWARTIRVCQPLPYFFSVLNNVTLWWLAWIAAVGVVPTFEGHTLASGGFVGYFGIPWELIVAMSCMLVRIVAAVDLQRRLSPMGSHLNHFWLVPIKDLLQFAIWAGAFLGSHIEWRGQRYRLRRDGTLEVQNPK